VYPAVADAVKSPPAVCVIAEAAADETVTAPAEDTSILSLLACLSRTSSLDADCRMRLPEDPSVMSDPVSVLNPVAYTVPPKTASFANVASSPTLRA